MQRRAENVRCIRSVAQILVLLTSGTNVEPRYGGPPVMRNCLCEGAFKPRAPVRDASALQIATLCVSALLNAASPLLIAKVAKNETAYAHYV